MTLCGLVDMYQRFGETCYLHLRDRVMSQKNYLNNHLRTDVRFNIVNEYVVSVKTLRFCGR